MNKDYRRSTRSTTDPRQLSFCFRFPIATAAKAGPAMMTPPPDARRRHLARLGLRGPIAGAIGEIAFGDGGEQ